LQKNLGDKYEVIEEGLRGRFLAGENPFVPERDGLKQFGPILASQFPVDLVILFLGTNDTNSRAHKSPQEIADGLNNYFEVIDNWCKEFRAMKPEVLIISPPHINEDVLKTDSMFEGAAKKSLGLAEYYQAIAKRHNALFFDSSTVAEPGVRDGVHIEAEAHKALGAALAPIVESAFVQ
jgi:lysophospholipase L1-like esterase